MASASRGHFARSVGSRHRRRLCRIAVVGCCFSGRRRRHDDHGRCFSSLSIVDLNIQFEASLKCRIEIYESMRFLQSNIMSSLREAIMLLSHKKTKTKNCFSFRFLMPAIRNKATLTRKLSSRVNQ
jgi:hypothetical protein